MEWVLGTFILYQISGVCAILGHVTRRRLRSVASRFLWRSIERFCILQPFHETAQSVCLYFHCVGISVRR